MHPTLAVPALRQATLINASVMDYLLIALYFVFVLGIGFIARRQVSDSIDFFLSGRRLPAWVTGLAFISANLGAVEIMGMSANGAEFGLATVHYFWIGAIPAMLFLGVVMMPFYYGSKVRSVPEFMFRRFGTGAHLVNALSFALAQLLIAGVNLYLLGSIVNALLGWPLWVALLVAAAIVLSYITLGGLSAAIYNEVLQFFVIVAALLPLTLIGLHRVGGWSGLKEKVAATSGGTEQLHSWPGTLLSGFDSPLLSVLGIVFGLGFVLSLRLLDDELRRGPAGHGVGLHLVGTQDADHRRLPQDVHPVHRHHPRHDLRGPRPGPHAIQGGRQGRWRDRAGRRHLQQRAHPPHA